MPFEKGKSGSPENQFSSEKRPSKLKGKNPLTKILKGELDKDTFVILEGKLVKELPNGNVQVKVKNPTTEAFISSIIRHGMKGNAKAMEIIFDRIEGKVLQQNQDLPPPKENQYNFEELTKEEYAELKDIELRREELLSKCETVIVEPDQEE